MKDLFLVAFGSFHSVSLTFCAGLFKCDAGFDFHLPYIEAHTLHTNDRQRCVPPCDVTALQQYYLRIPRFTSFAYHRPPHHTSSVYRSDFIS
uniref:Putative secreted peptide n=1 Tax=Anopheles braziliensis TaxID=58242 RepID=A0A2M3ZNQ0_9DIPT